MTKLRHTISEVFVRLLFDYLDVLGIDAEKLLNEPRPEPTLQQSGGFPLVRWVALLERSEQHLNDPFLGLHLGQTVTPRHVGAMGYLLQSLPTLADMIQKLEFYQRLLYDQTPMIRSTGPGYVDLMWGAEQGLPGRLADDASIASLIQYCRVATDKPIAPLRVRFIGDEPLNTAPYIDYFGCPVEFGAAHTGVRFSLDVLQLPLRAKDPALCAMMEQHADELLAMLPMEEPTIEQVRKAIARLLHDGKPELRTVAAKLNLTPRSMQRRLHEANSSFRHELAVVRGEMVEIYLRDPHLTIADVAQLVGYSEHSSLTRSYRQRSGLTPQIWRDRTAK